MTATYEGPVTARDDWESVAWDLATVAGALSEIATTWRRAKPRHPGLPVALPQHLADLAGRLAADARSLAGTGARREARGGPGREAQHGPGREARRGPEQPNDQELAMRMSVLREGAAYAQAITSGPGAPLVGDARLWEFVRPVLQRSIAADGEPPAPRSSGPRAAG